MKSINILSTQEIIRRANRRVYRYRYDNSFVMGKIRDIRIPGLTDVKWGEGEWLRATIRARR